MGNKKLDNIFDEEIKKREESSQWSERITSNVFSFIENEQAKKKRIFDIVSYAFPLAAAALLIIALTFGFTSSNESIKQLQASYITTYGISKDTLEYSYDEIDFYIDQYYSQR